MSRASHHAWWATVSSGAVIGAERKAGHGRVGEGRIDDPASAGRVATGGIEARRCAPSRPGSRRMMKDKIEGAGNGTAPGPEAEPRRGAACGCGPGEMKKACRALTAAGRKERERFYFLGE